MTNSMKMKIAVYRFAYTPPSGQNMQGLIEKMNHVMMVGLETSVEGEKEKICVQHKVFLCVPLPNSLRLVVFLIGPTPSDFPIMII